MIESSEADGGPEKGAARDEPTHVCDASCFARRRGAGRVEVVRGVDLFQGFDTVQARCLRRLRVGRGPFARPTRARLHTVDGVGFGPVPPARRAIDSASLLGRAVRVDHSHATEGAAQVGL